MRKPPQRRGFRTLYLWHRYFGLAAALFVVNLVLTGVLVQHANLLGLHRNYLDNSLLLRWYGVTPNPVISYRAGNHWVSHSGEFLYIDGKPANGKYPDLQGAADAGLLLAVISAETVALFTREGELVERIGFDEGLPETPLSIAYQASVGVVVQGERTVWQPTKDWLDWSEYHGPPLQWPYTHDTPHHLLVKIQQHNLSQEISWERVLLDLHSGRLLGSYGIYAIDVAALGMLFLAFSGVWVWSQRRPSRGVRKIGIRR